MDRMPRLSPILGVIISIGLPLLLPLIPLPLPMPMFLLQSTLLFIKSQLSIVLIPLSLKVRWGGGVNFGQSGNAPCLICGRN